MDPGNYSVKFNSTGLASGIYYYRLQTSNFIVTKKMILLK
ncbi:MAG: T9SS type A sorting domain-containing protein [Candidatus Kariarchaeaceae archaeon]